MMDDGIMGLFGLLLFSMTSCLCVWEAGTFCIFLFARIFPYTGVYTLVDTTTQPERFFHEWGRNKVSEKERNLCVMCI